MDVNFDDLHLTKRQAIFVKVYVSENNGTKAALAAGFSPKGAGQQACRLLKQENVQAALARIRASVVAKVNEPQTVKDNLSFAVDTAQGIAITAENLMFQLAQQGLTQGILAKFLTQQDGHLFFDFSDATPEELQAISPQIAEVSFTCETRTEEGATKESAPVQIRTIRSKVKWVDRARVIELMGRYKEIMAWKDSVESNNIHVHITRSVVSQRNPERRRATPEAVARVLDAHRGTPLVEPNG
jgi:Terminase small subunit